MRWPIGGMAACGMLCMAATDRDGGRQDGKQDRPR